jgi:hypothetical protein
VKPGLHLNTFSEHWIVRQERSIHYSITQERLQKSQLAFAEWQDGREHRSRLIEEVLGERVADTLRLTRPLEDGNELVAQFAPLEEDVTYRYGAPVHSVRCPVHDEGSAQPFWIQQVTRKQLMRVENIATGVPALVVFVRAMNPLLISSVLQELSTVRTAQPWPASVCTDSLAAARSYTIR